MHHELHVRPVLRLAALARALVLLALGTASVVVLVRSTIAFADVADGGEDAPEGGADGGVADGGVDAAIDAGNATPTLEDLRPPVTPAFTLLGITPTEVEHPTTPRELGVALGGAIGTKAPTSLAISFAPYWLVRHDGVSVNELDSEWEWHWLRTATVSVAATEVAADPADPMSTSTSLMSMAVNTLLWKGKAAVECPTENGLFVLNEEMQRAKEEAFAAWRVEFEANEAKYRADHPGMSQEDYAAHAQKLMAQQQAILTERGIEAVEQRLEDIAGIYEKRVEELKLCTEAQSVLRGFSFGAAGGAVLAFPNGEWDDVSMNSFAAWISPSYRNDSLSLVGLGRFTRDMSTDAESSYLDFGGRVTYVGRRAHLSIEPVVRVGDDIDTTWRLAALVEVQVKDTWVVAGIGKDYDSSGGEKFFATANVQFDIGDAQLTSSDKDIEAISKKMSELKKQQQAEDDSKKAAVADETQDNPSHSEQPAASLSP